MPLMYRPLKRLSGLSKVHLSIFILVFAAIGGCILLISHAASPANVYVSTTGNDSTCVRGDSTKPCLSFNQAYRLAQQRDTVEVAGGIYPSQTIGADASKTAFHGNCRLTYNGNGTFTEDDSGCVTFQPAQGATVTIGCKTTAIGAGNLTTQTTISVTSTAGCPQDPSNPGFYKINLSGTYYCSGKDVTNFTGCFLTTGGSDSSCITDTSANSGTQANICLWKDQATVRVGSLAIHASYVKIHDMTIGAGFSTDTETDDILDGVTASGGNWMTGSYIDLENSLTGDNNNGSKFLEENNCSHCAIYKSVARNTTDNGCTIHGLCHTEDVRFDGGAGQAAFYYIGNTSYGGGGSGNLFWTYGSNVAMGQFVLVNNMIGPPCCTSNVEINANAQTLPNWIIEGNSSSGSWAFTATGTGSIYSSWMIAGNVGINFPCTPHAGISYSGVNEAYDISTGTACSSSGASLTANNNMAVSSLSSEWTNASIADLDLTGGPYFWENTWASCPLSVDIHGNTRPATCTPGADQRTSSSSSTCPTGDLNGDCHVTIADLSILMSNFGSSKPACDLNKDGIVNISDLSLLLSHYGT